MPKLFQGDIQDKGDPKEWFIKQKDASSFSGRVRRLKYLHKLNPEGKTFMGNIEMCSSPLFAHLKVDMNS